MDAHYILLIVVGEEIQMETCMSNSEALGFLRRTLHDLEPKIENVGGVGNNGNGKEMVLEETEPA